MKHRVVLTKSDFIKRVESYTKVDIDPLYTGSYYLKEDERQFPALLYYDCNYQNDSFSYELIPLRAKTYNPPSIFVGDAEQKLSTLIGIIDGDGNIGNQYKRKDVLIRIKCHGSWLNYYTQCFEFLSNLIKVKMSKPYIQKNGYMVWTISNRIVVNYLYQFLQSRNLPVLERKWQYVKNGGLSDE